MSENTSDVPQIESVQVPPERTVKSTQDIPLGDSEFLFGPGHATYMYNLELLDDDKVYLVETGSVAAKYGVVDLATLTDRPAFKDNSGPAVYTTVNLIDKELKLSDPSTDAGIIAQMERSGVGSLPENDPKRVRYEARKSNLAAKQAAYSQRLASSKSFLAKLEEKGALEENGVDLENIPKLPEVGSGRM